MPIIECADDALQIRHRHRTCTGSWKTARQCVAIDYTTPPLKEAAATQSDELSDNDHATIQQIAHLHSNADYEDRRDVARYLRNRGITDEILKTIGQVTRDQIAYAGHAHSGPGMLVPVSVAAPCPDAPVAHR